jgi:hypothetical protein
MALRRVASGIASIGASNPGLGGIGNGARRLLAISPRWAGALVKLARIQAAHSLTRALQNCSLTGPENA